MCCACVSHVLGFDPSILHHTTPYYTILHHTAPYCTILHHTTPPVCQFDAMFREVNRNEDGEYTRDVDLDREEFCNAFDSKSEEVKEERGGEGEEGRGKREDERVM